MIPANGPAPVTPERWQQIKEVFQAALDLPEAERRAWLDAACGADHELKLEVESLLAVDSESDVVLEQAARAFPQQVLDAVAPGGAEGRRIGAYRIVREIGHGGMGTVYLASRADAAFRKDVAIKVVGQGVSDDIVRRFESERQILANLDHPNIARLLDGGTTEDSVPYFVMEYIEGQSITEYCDAHALKTVDRLKLFREVCGAVHYAHWNHVVHRDIKPGNILVTPAGVPKLLDFGIAKIVDPAGAAAGEALPTLRLMTPDYASPEQVRSEPITIASDIYSLGVLLYELLTGHRPYRMGMRPPSDLARAICDEEPERPSAAIGRTDKVPATTGPGVITLTPAVVSGTRDGQPEKLRRRLLGDLDTIVLMALRKEPVRRYLSVEELSNDIERHLEGRPVKARRDSTIYRSGKFLRRHPVGTTWTAFATVMAGVVGLVLTGAFGAQHAVAFANRDWLAIADFQNRTGESVFDSSLNTALALTLEQSRRVNVFPRRSIEGSLRRMKKADNTPVDVPIAREIAQREGLRLVLAPAIGEVGGVYLLSAALLDPATGAPLKSESARAASKREILAALDTLSRKVRADLGEVGEAIARESKPLSQVTTDSLEALKLFSVAQERARAARFDDAKALYERALQLDPKFVAARASLGMVEFELFDRVRGKAIAAELPPDLEGLTEREQYTDRAFYATIVENNLPKAEETWKALLALYPDTSVAHNNLGRVYLLMNRYEDAAASFKEAIRLDPYLVPSYVNLINIYLDEEGDPEAAIAVCKKLLSYNAREAWGYGLLGRASLGVGRPTDAVTAFERALEIGPAYVQVLDGLGAAYRELGRYDDALRAFLRTLAIDSRHVSAHYEAGVVSQLMGDDRAARRHFDRFRRAIEDQLVSQPDNAGAYFDLACTSTRLGDPGRGKTLGQRAHALDGADHFDMARLLSLQGANQEAVDALDLAVKEGFRDFIEFRVHPDLAPLAVEPRFQQLLSSVLRH
jgi:serine/threonine protein kinase/tetratricopeptide (TPR) repeat protein